MTDDKQGERDTMVTKTIILSSMKLVLLMFSLYIFMQDDYAKASYFLLIVLILTDAYEFKR